MSSTRNEDLCVLSISIDPPFLLSLPGLKVFRSTICARVRGRRSFCHATQMPQGFCSERAISNEIADSSHRSESHDPNF
jgi:hypothetical protein